MTSPDLTRLFDTRRSLDEARQDRLDALKALAQHYRETGRNRISQDALAASSETGQRLRDQGDVIDYLVRKVETKLADFHPWHNRFVGRVRDALAATNDEERRMRLEWLLREVGE